ncbi:MAG: dihydroorotase [Bacteroidales bacterium]|nr:dihydroorotase [Bacteroidales bacterium]
MSQVFFIINANIVNEGEIFFGNVLVEDKFISKIFRRKKNSTFSYKTKDIKIVDAENNYLFPGLIDDQVHFREPGLTHKADISTESKAAVAGGITSFMEMPNTFPPAITQELLEDKYKLASQKSLANYSFYLGATNDNLDEILKTDPKKVCGLKVFMGASTGNMLVDDPIALENIFSQSKLLIATHSEDETIIKENIKKYKEKFSENVPIEMHPKIRSEKACYKSSSYAVELAKKHSSRLHILHLSTAKELNLFDNSIPLKDKKITAEVCVHHLWFNESDYKNFGNRIKWNPAIKTAFDQKALFNGVLDNKIDVIATDHAPHTCDEKNNSYFNSPSGGPLVQHSLSAMLDFFHKGIISIEKIVDKMCHSPAICFKVKKRGFIREGYFADLTIVNCNSPWKVKESNILSKCKWSPFEGHTFQSKITHTFVNGNLVYENGNFNETKKGERLLFY